MLNYHPPFLQQFHILLSFSPSLLKCCDFQYVVQSSLQNLLFCSLRVKQCAKMLVIWSLNSQVFFN